MKIVKINGKYYTFSFTDGLKTRQEPNLRKEASKNPDAVINRLMNNGKWDLASQFMDEFV